MKLYFTCCLLVVLLGLYACRTGYKEDPSFDDKITILENQPQVLLFQLDTCNTTRITDESEATLYLLQTLVRSYTVKGFLPDKEKLEKCIDIFKSKRKIQQQLEALYLLAGIYAREKDTRREVEIIEQAMSLAQQIEDSVWMFHLYSYLSDMYFRQFDMLKFIKYQALAKQSIKEVRIDELDIHTLTLLGKSYLYTDQPELAEQFLSRLAERVEKQHICYSDVHRLLGVAYFKQRKWLQAVEGFERSLTEERDSSNLFTCYSMLTRCQYRLGNRDQAKYYKDQTLRYEREGKTSYSAIEFYRVCAEFAEQVGDYAEETRCLQKAVGKYEQMVKELNGQTLDEAIQGYMRMQDQKENDDRIRVYHRLLFGMILLLICMFLYFANKRKRQAYRYLNLQRRIEVLEKLEGIQDETKALILRDLDVAKQVAMLKYTQREKSEKLLKELDKLDLLKGNTLLTTKWPDFYHHIDITFDHFYTKLVQRYPSLVEKEIQLCCLIVAGFRTEEIAAVWMQSVFTVHKYKTSIRKKMEAPEGADILAFLKEKLY